MIRNDQAVTQARGVDLDDPRRIAAAVRLEQSISGNLVLDRLSGLAARLLGAGSAQVSLLTDVQVVAGGTGLGAIAVAAGPSPRSESLCAVTAASGRPLVVGDAHHDARIEALPPVLAGAVGSYLGIPLSDGDGLVVGAFCVYDRDARTWTDSEILVLTELAAANTAELERSAAESERDLARLQFALAMESGGIGSWEWDLPARRMTANAQFLAMFGLDAALEHTAVPVSTFIAVVHPDDRDRVAVSVNTTLDTGAEYVQEYRVLQPDGSVRWIAARRRALYDNQHRAVRLVGAAYDTTDRHLAAESAQSESTLMALIARASDLLAGSLEAEDAVRSFARLVVPVLADWSVVSIVGDDGLLRDVDWWHHDPAKRALAGVFAAHRLDGRTEARGSLAALSTGEPFVKNAGALEFAIGTLRSDAAIEALRALGLQSVGVFPLAIEGQVICLITLARDSGRPPFSRAEIAAAQDLSRRAGITLANAQSFGREREMSEQLQRSMLTAPVTPDDVQVVVRYLPASKVAQVGGDWYDAFAQPDRSTVLVVGDVVGHDSVAAAVMGQLRSILRGIAVANGGGPAELLRDLDRSLGTLEMTTNATVLVARVEGQPGSGRSLSWSNAGHPPPIVVDADGSWRSLDTHDVLLGVAADLPRREECIELTGTQTVLMYTDGLVERRDEDIDLGIARLGAAAASGIAEPLDVLVDRLLLEMLPEAPDDDVVLLALRMR
ncbi:hypothetical protein BH10ACT10_BH10ACT10_24690 [soil metagenome]